MYKVIFVGTLCLFLINFIITYMIIFGGNKKRSTKEILAEDEEQMSILKNRKYMKIGGNKNEI